MNPQLLLIVVLLLFIGLMWYATAKLKNKLLCTFIRANLTKVEKLVPIQARFVVFDGGKYYVDAKRIVLHWYNRGIHQFFPQWVPSVIYKWDSSAPINPRDFKNTWDTPEARQAASSEDDWKGFNRGMASQVGKKSNVLIQYLPYIAIIVLVILGFMMYTQGQRMDMLEQLMRVRTGG